MKGGFSGMCAPTFRAIAGPWALDAIARYLDSFWISHSQVPPAVRIRLGIAVNEIAANIVKHATIGIERPVDLQIWAGVRDHDVLVTLADDGVAAPDGLLTRGMPHELDESGRGIPLARATLSLLDYQRIDGVNIWTLVSERF